MIDSKDLRWFQCAINRAKLSTHYKSKVAAFIVPGGKNYCTLSSTNIEKSHPIQKAFNIKYRDLKNDPCRHYLHAEMSCLLDNLKQGISMRGSTIYVARVSKTGDIRMARPCPACMAAIKQVGISEIYYTTNEGYAYEHINIDNA